MLRILSRSCTVYKGYELAGEYYKLFKNSNSTNSCMVEAIILI